MGYTEYVGRVGALAVALGIGGAVANGSGIALAAPQSEHPGVGSTAPDDPPTGGPTTTDGPNSPTRHDRPRARPVGVRDAISDVREALETLAGSMQNPSRTHFAHRTQPDGREAPQVPSGAASTRTVVVRRDTPRKPSASPRHESAPRVERTVDDVKKTVVDDVRKTVEDTRQRFVSRPVGSLPTRSGERRPEANVDVVDPSDGQARTLDEHPQARITVAAARPLPRLLSLFGLGAIPGNGGAPPRENPLIASVLGWVRRLERTFDNRTPTTDYKAQQVVQVDADRAVGYLDPVDPDSSKLTYTATTTDHGTVTFDQTTPGKFTYTAPEGRDETQEWTDTVTITTSDAQSGWHIHGLAGLFEPDAGHTTTQTVSIVLKPVDAPDVADDGTVTGHVPADNSTLSYTLDGSVPEDVGTVELDAATGTWVFTPSVSAQQAAGSGGATSYSFTIVAGDTEHRTPIKVTTPISPASATSLPDGAVPQGPAASGTDGSVVQVSTVGNETYLTVVDRDGVTHVSRPLSGAPAGNAVSAGGNAYLATFDGTNTHLNIVLPDGSVKTTVVQGQTQGTIVVGPDGAAYITSTVAGTQTLSNRAGFARMAMTAQTMAVGPLDPDTGSDTSNVTVLGTDGSTYEVTALPGHKAGDIVVAEDGFAYQTTYRSEAGVYETYVTVIDKDARTSATTDPISGEPRQLIVSSDGTAYQLVYTPGADLDGEPGNDVGTDQTAVNTISHDGTVTQHVLSGDSITSEPVVDGNGRIYVTTQAYSPADGSQTSYLVTIDPGGHLESAQLPGDNVFRGVVFDSDGVAYLASYESGFDENGTFSENTYVTVIAPNGAIPNPTDAESISGTPRDKGIFLGPNGNAYITTSDGTAVYVSTIGQDGGIDELASLPGSAQDSAIVTPSGGIYVTTYEWSPNGTTLFHANLIDADGTVHTTLLHGDAPDHSVVIDPNGVVYQTTTDYVTGKTYVTAIRPDGTTRETVGIPGNPTSAALVVGPDGTVYQTTYSFSPSQTWVSAITADGSVRISDPLAGPAPGGVFFGADGKVYQPRANGAVALNPSTWTLYAAPTVPITLPSGAAPVAPAVVSNGTLYQASYDASINKSYVTVVGSDGSSHDSAPLPGKAYGDVQFGKGGIVYQTTADASGQTYVNAITPAGDVVTTNLRGHDGSLVVGTDGTVVASSVGSDGVFLTVFDAAGTAHDVVFDGEGTPDEIDAMPGTLRGTLVVGPDGTVYAATNMNDSNGVYSTNIAVVNSDGSIRIVDSAGAEEVVKDGFAIGANGSAYLTTLAGNQSFVSVIDGAGMFYRHYPPLSGEATGAATLTSSGTAYVSTWDRKGTPDLEDDRAHLYAVDATGGVTELADVSGIGYQPPVVGANGEIYQTYATHDSVTNTFTTRLVVIDSAGNLHLTDPMPGVPQQAVQIGQDGVAYQVMRPAVGANETDLYTVSPDGTTVKVGQLPGQLSGRSLYVAPDGSITVTTYTRAEADAQTRDATYLTVIGADGVPHTTSVPRLPEETPGDQSVVVGSDGTVYQLTLDVNARQNYVATIRPDGTVHAGTPLPGDDPAYQALVRAPNGTVYLTSTVQGPGGVGGQTYVAIVQPDGGVKYGAPLSGNALAGVVFGPNGTAYQVTDEGTYALDSTGWVVHHAPETGGSSVDAIDDGDGSVTGSVNATDLDADTLTYEADPDSDVVVDVHEDGTWTFTPTAAQRAAAYYGTGPTEVTFTVIATDGMYRTPVTVTAPIDPDAGNAIVLPSGASPTAALVVDDSGTAYQRSYDQTTNTSYLTVVRTDGTAFTSAPMPGSTIDAPVATANGTLYQLSSDSIENKTYLNAIDADGHIVTTEIRGQLLDSVVVQPNNTVYLVSQESTGDGNVGTFVTVAGPGSVHTSEVIEGGLQGPIVVDGNGTAYLTTTNGAQSFVTVVNSDGDVVGTAALSRAALSGVVLGSAGTAYQTTYDGDGTYVATVGADGTVNPEVVLTGQPSSIPVAGPNGTVIQTTYDPGAHTTYVTAIAPDGSVVYTQELTGSTGTGPVVGADGTVYQMYYTDGADGDPNTFETYVVAINADGSEANVTDPITGLAHIAGIKFGADGVAYLITNTESPGDQQTYVTTFDAQGHVLKVAELQGLPVDGTYHAAADGTVYMVTYQQVPSSSDPQQTYVNFVDADGTVHQTVVDRAAYFGDIAVDDDGTVYVLTIDYGTNQTYVTTIDARGNVHDSTPLPGQPNSSTALAVSPGGTVYVTTSFNDGELGQTHVATVGPDGSLRVRDALLGYASGGVVFDAAGTAYQSTQLGTAVLDPSDFSAATLTV